jgi:DNA polymerase/3'-5' exonuclease PolX
MEYFYNIGEKQAKLLTDHLLKLGLIEKNKEYSIEEYKQILKTPAIFAELPLATQMDLLHNPLRSIPREYIKIIEDELKKYLSDLKFDIAGSYIRGKPASSDIDLVLLKTKDDMWEYFSNQINKSEHIRFLEPFAHGEDKIGTLIQILNKKVTVKIDIFLCDKDSYVYTLLFAIGSGHFNVRMRSIAKRKGYLLNNKGLYKILNNGELVRLDLKTEEEIFHELGMIYRKPSERVR